MTQKYNINTIILIILLIIRLLGGAMFFFIEVGIDNLPMAISNFVVITLYLLGTYGILIQKKWGALLVGALIILEVIGDIVIWGSNIILILLILLWSIIGFPVYIEYKKLSSNSQAYKKEEDRLGYYIRPYCENCKLIYSRRNLEESPNCPKCDKILKLKSFNPIGGIFEGIWSFFFFYVLSAIVSLTKIEIDGFFIIGMLGIAIWLTISSLFTWIKIKKIDKINNLTH